MWSAGGLCWAEEQPGWAGWLAISAGLAVPAGPVGGGVFLGVNSKPTWRIMYKSICVLVCVQL